MPKPSAQEHIDQLKLLRHPEGGWFRETYRSVESVPAPRAADCVFCRIRPSITRFEGPVPSVARIHAAALSEVKRIKKTSAGSNCPSVNPWA